MKIILFTLLIFCATTLSPAQSVTDLKSRYGKPARIYLVRPDVAAVVTANKDGRISELRLERFSSAEKTISLDTTFSPRLAREIVDELAPVESRGEKNDSPALSVTMGGATWSSEVYENVSITYYSNAGGITTIVIKWRGRPKSPQP